MILSATDDRAPSPETDGAVRARILRAGIDLFRVHAFHAVTLEMVAAGAGLPLDVVPHEFPALDDLAVVTVAAWHAERVAPIASIAAEHGAVAFLRAIIVANIDDPALVRLLLAMTNIAATPDHPNAPVLQQAWVQFHATVQRALANDVAIGREPGTMEPAHGAEQLIALYEGLQVQATMRPHMDLLGAYDRAVTRMRDGWTSAYRQPIWEI